uniref:E2F transcription factor 5 n=1 Tax=Kryptolebias marmoratus TaxID=37003 RepID=A0A3Q2Z9X9_KRYMA
VKTSYSAMLSYTLLAVVAPSGTQLEVPLPEMCKSGQKKYQVNLRSHSAPIQVLLINRDSGSTVPVVFPVPPTDDICPMPTPPSTPASLQRFPLPNSECSAASTTSPFCSQDSISVDIIDELMSANETFFLHPVFSPHAGMDYSFNLEDNEGVCDLFDVQILNY